MDQAKAGQEIELTRRGRYFGDAYRAFLEQHSLIGIGLDDNLLAATRDKTPGRKVAL